MSRNPYEPPKANTSGVPAAAGAMEAPHPNELLYSPAQIFLAAFLGGPSAGAWAGMTNYQAVNQPDEGRAIFGWSIVVLVALLAVSFVLPAQIPVFVVWLGASFGIRAVAEMKFGAVVKQHRAAGGELVSWGRVVGIAVLFAAITFSLFYVAMILA